MLTDYLPDDILQYVVNEYMSHHHDDMAAIQVCVRNGFVFNTSKYVQIELRYHNAMRTKIEITEIQVDGYIAVKVIYDYWGNIEYQQLRKYGKLHETFIHDNPYAGAQRFIIFHDDNVIFSQVPHPGVAELLKHELRYNNTNVPIQILRPHTDVLILCAIIAVCIAVCKLI